MGVDGLAIINLTRIDAAITDADAASAGTSRRHRI